MKKENGYYIDVDGNTWNSKIYTEDQAVKNSESLVNCSFCSDCSFCSFCSDCSSCSSCSYCRDCSSCSYCISCNNCRSCSYCRSCRDCSFCSDCAEFKSNPMRIAKKLTGTCNTLAQVYWIDDNVQCVFGCWKGKSLDEFRNKAKEQVTREQLPAFMNFIDVAEYAIKQL